MGARPSTAQAVEAAIAASMEDYRCWSCMLSCDFYYVFTTHIHTSFTLFLQTYIISLMHSLVGSLPLSYHYPPTHSLTD